MEKYRIMKSHLNKTMPYYVEEKFLCFWFIWRNCWDQMIFYETLEEAKAAVMSEIEFIANKKKKPLVIESFNESI